MRRYLNEHGHRIDKASAWAARGMSFSPASILRRLLFIFSISAMRVRRHHRRFIMRLRAHQGTNMRETCRDSIYAIIDSHDSRSVPMTGRLMSMCAYADGALDW